MKKIRILSLLLAVAMVCTLAACGGSPETAETEAVHTESAAESAEPTAAGDEESAEATEAPAASSTDELYAYDLPLVAEGEDNELSMWYVYPGFFSSFKTYPDDSDWVAAMEELTGVHIEYTIVQTETCTDQFSLMISGGEYCDLLYNFDALYTFGIDYAIEEEIIIDLAPYLDQMPCFNYYYSNSEELQKSFTTSSGAIGGFYGFSDEPMVVYGTVIRQDWLDELELDVPVTYDDYYDVLTAFKNTYGGTMWLNYTGVPQSNYLISGFDIAGFSNSGFQTYPFYVVDDVVYFGPIQEAYKEYLTMLNQWYSEGLIYQDFMTGTSVQDIDDELINTGAVGLWFSNTEDCRNYTADSTGDENFAMTGISDALMHEGQTLHLGPDVGLSNGLCVSISAQCKNLELALKWLDFQYSEAGAELDNWGREGVGYDVDEAGNRTISTNITNAADGTPDVVMEAIITAGQFATVLYKEREEMGYSETEMTMVRTWEASSDFAYNYPSRAKLSSEDSNTFSLMYADIETYLQEETLKFIVGSRSLDEFDAFVETIESMGIDELIAMKQNAYDTYNG